MYRKRKGSSPTRREDPATDLEARTLETKELQAFRWYASNDVGPGVVELGRTVRGITKKSSVTGQMSAPSSRFNLHAPQIQPGSKLNHIQLSFSSNSLFT